MSSSFQALSIRSELVDLLIQEGIITPTPVQETAIPVLLKGKDAIVQAQTGTGKTLAFALPILEGIHSNKSYTQALILTPTRELAIQITGELSKLAPPLGVSVLAAYGGQDVESQIRKLKNAPHVIIATPGRLLDHLRRETVTLSSIRMLVLDEADQMLHMGFLKEVEAIIDQCSLKRQTMLFSATMPAPVKQLATRYMDSPEDIRIRSAAVTLDAIDQLVIDTTDRNKQALLLSLLDSENPYLAVVFCRTKLRAKKLTEALQEAGVPADELHGDLTQAKRETVMKRFRRAKLQVLVATDVAARGLDVEGVTHVFNYDAPTDGDSYIHRIGRTGRAGESGRAITLATQRDRMNLETIEQKIRAKLKHAPGSKFGVGHDSSEEQSDSEARKPKRSGSPARGGSKGGAGGGRGGARGGIRGGLGREADRGGFGREADRAGGRERPAARGAASRSGGGAGARTAGAAANWSDEPRGSSGFSPRGGSASGGRSGGAERSSGRDSGGFSPRGGSASGGRSGGAERSGGRDSGGFSPRGGSASGGRSGGAERSGGRDSGGFSPRGGSASGGRSGGAERSGGRDSGGFSPRGGSASGGRSGGAGRSSSPSSSRGSRPSQSGRSGGKSSGGQGRRTR
ncbi:DEAD/DEAH box helicase [Paenibacillus herberti]|uniref:DEAD/DEAH box helicase n=1 Tax=Paenibacillus herberti TaxID=1619309 RepID=A0A229P3Q9_9BACL|nr:DEAD/DEAH box helicase [Paenibacillus herberti]OXM16882.1 DEAD/DEAH box helicase [Paenibacillus herberti]